MILSKLHNLFVFAIILSGMCLNSINAEHVNYWDLSPQSSIKVDDKILFSYPAQVLMSRPSNTQVEVLLQIKDGLNSQKYNQTWVKGDLNNDNGIYLSQFSMGDEVLLLIDPIHPDKMTLDCNNLKTSWAHTDGENWMIPTDINPISNLNLKGIEYLIYPGEIVTLSYKTRIDYHYRAEKDGIEHQLEIDIKIKGIETPHYHENLKDSVDASQIGELHQLNGFIRTLRHWSVSDQIKILVNSNFPGFWWIVNETRNEAIFVAQGHPIEHTTDLWSRVGV